MADQAERRQIKRRISGAARRARFLDAAAEIVVEQGVGAVTMDGIAARTAVDKRLGYKYFDNRDDLIGELLKREMAEITARSEARVRPDFSLGEILKETTTIWLSAFAEKGPLLHRLLHDRETGGEGGRQIREKALSDWIGTLLEKTALTRLQAHVSARIMLSAIGGAVDALEDGVAPMEEIVDIYCRIAVAGAEAIAPVGSSPSPGGRRPVTAIPESDPTTRRAKRQPRSPKTDGDA